MITISDDIILHSFDDIWFTNCNTRYRLLKGGRSTGKTRNFVGYEPIFKILSDKRRNIVFVRQNYKDNGNSNYSEIKKCIYELKLQHLFQFKVSPLQIIRKDTGQMMLFGGMNDVENLTSTSFVTGYWTDTYFEEASQLKSYEDFRVVDGSMRIPNTETDIKCQITFLFNAWDVGHWTYDIFFKDRLEDDIAELERKGYQFYSDENFNLGQDGSGLALHISSYKCNTFNSDQKIKNILEYKEKAYSIYLVEGLGCWGNTLDAVYPEFTNDLVKPRQVLNNQEYAAYTIGIDFGISNGEGKVYKGEDANMKINAATTMQLVGLTKDYNKLSMINEYFWSNETAAIKKTGPAIQEELIDKIIEWKELYVDNYTLMKGIILVYVDCADPGGFRQGLELMAKQKGLYNVKFIGSTKMKIQSRVDFMRLLMAMGDVEFSDACPNLIRETKNARRGDKGQCRQDTNDHAINASEYAWYVLKDRLRRWKNFKERG